MPNFYPISTANKIFHGMLIEHTFIISLPKLQCALIFNIKKYRYYIFSFTMYLYNVNLVKQYILIYNPR